MPEKKDEFHILVKDEMGNPVEVGTENKKHMHNQIIEVLRSETKKDKKMAAGGHADIKHSWHYKVLGPL